MLDPNVFSRYKTKQDFDREAQEFEARKRQQALQEQLGNIQLQQGQMGLQKGQAELDRIQAQKQMAQRLGEGQDIESLLVQQAQVTGDPSAYIDYKTQMRQLDYKNQAALEQLRQRQQIQKEGGSVSSYMRDAQKLMEYNPNLDPMQAYGLARGGIGQGSYLNPETGMVEPLPGFADARGAIRMGEAAGSARGTPLGEAQAEYDSLVSSYPELRESTNELSKLAQVATYTAKGRFTDDVRRQLGLDVGNAAEAAAKMTTIIDTEVLPLLKPTFGAAFTVNEGQWLRATMGDLNLSPEEKIAQITARVEAWNRRLKTLERRTGESLPEDVGQMMQRPLGMTMEAPQMDRAAIEETLFNARKAVRDGRNPDLVRQRLLDAGIDPAEAGL